jgi:hypothetical protein
MRMTREQALSLTAEDRLIYFRDVRLKHPQISNVLEKLDLMTAPDTGTSIALLVGPTGVGKSTIVRNFEQQILRNHMKQMQADAGLIPVISVEAPATGERAFSWRTFYHRLGEALQEPMMTRKQETVYRDGRASIRPVMTGSTVAALQLAVESTLIHRQTKVIIVDEAVHLLRNLHGNTLENHLDALKYLSNKSGAKLVLVGSYDLHGLLDVSAQITRRCSIIHFQRYLPDKEADVLAFQKVLRKFAAHFPIEGAEDLPSVAQAKALQEACIGCVGILKETLVRALAIAMREGNRWRNGFLEPALLTPAQVRAIHREALEGEAKVDGTICGTGSFLAASRQVKENQIRAKGAA